MTSNGRSPSPTPSISSMVSDVLAHLSLEEVSLREDLRKRLSKRMFLAHYQERRFVEPLDVYRDMVVLHSSEEELKQELKICVSKLFNFYGFNKWIGITKPDTVGAPSAGYCLWVKLQDLPFGFYWFQVRRVVFRDSEVSLSLKVIRPVREEIVTAQTSTLDIKKTLSDNVDVITSGLRARIHAFSKSQNIDPPETSDIDVKSSSDPTKSFPSSEYKSTAPKSCKTEYLLPDSTSDQCEKPAKAESLTLKDFFLLLQFSVKNWKDIIHTLILFLVGAVKGLALVIHYVGEFSLKFMREVSFFCRSITPIVLAVIELVGKAIGGLYLLLAMIFRPNYPNSQTIRRQPIMPPPFRVENRRIYQGPQSRGGGSTRRTY